MNVLNYATLEASKRLIDAGIVLETEVFWYWDQSGKWVLVRESSRIMQPVIAAKEAIPAPSMAEIWRELPEEIISKGLVCYLNMEKGCTGYKWFDNYQKAIGNINMTDALIDLLIWVRKENGK